MKRLYNKVEAAFEAFSGAAVKLFSNPITFILAIIIVVIYFMHKPVFTQPFYKSIYDLILCFTFLGFFIIQKVLSKYNTALNLKINELLSAHEQASNRMVNIEKKSATELEELNKHYNEISVNAEKNGELHTAKSIEQKLLDKDENV